MGALSRALEREPQPPDVAPVLHYVKSQSAENLRERLKQGYLANAARDLEIAQEWFPLEEVAWKKLDSKKNKK